MSIKARFITSISLLCVLALVAGSCAAQEKPEGILTVAELLNAPAYDTEVKIYGEVGLLGKLNCPCFELTSSGRTVQVWYGLMVQNDGTERPSVDVEGINNGDRVIVTVELNGEGGTYYSKGDFWGAAIVSYNKVCQ